MFPVPVRTAILLTDDRCSLHSHLIFPPFALTAYHHTTSTAHQGMHQVSYPLLSSFTHDGLTYTLRHARGKVVTQFYLLPMKYTQISSQK